MDFVIASLILILLLQCILQSAKQLFRRDKGVKLNFVIGSANPASRARANHPPTTQTIPLAWSPAYTPGRSSATAWAPAAHSARKPRPPFGRSTSILYRPPTSRRPQRRWWRRRSFYGAIGAKGSIWRVPRFKPSTQRCWQPSAPPTTPIQPPPPPCIGTAACRWEDGTAA